MSVTASRPRIAMLLTAVVTTTVALTLAGCGPSGTTTAPAGGTQSGTGGTIGQTARQPGVSGLIAAVSGKTLQVQGTDGQTAVSYTAKTTITEVATTTAAALKTGLCANVRSTADGASASPTDQVTATSVTLSPAANGRCDAGFGGGGRAGGAPSGAPTGLPSGAPSDRPSGAAPGGGRGGFGFGANGLVSSISGAAFVVDSVRPGATGSTATKITVSTTGSTTWSEVKAATSKAVVVGRCGLAIGKTDSTGAVAATTLRISSATNGSCNTGGRGPGQRNGGTGTGQPGSGQGNG